MAEEAIVETNEAQPVGSLSELTQLCEISDRTERAIRAQEILTQKVLDLASLIPRREEIGDAGRTSSFWKTLLLAARAEEQDYLHWLDDSPQTRDDKTLHNLVRLNFGLFSLAERRFDPSPLRFKGESADKDQLGHINDFFHRHGFRIPSDQETAEWARRDQPWESPLRRGKKTDKAKDAYIAFLSRKVVTSLVPKKYLTTSFEPLLPDTSTEREAKMTTSMDPKKTASIQEKILPLLDQFIKGGRDVFDKFDLDPEKFQAILNGWNAETFVFLCLRNLGLDTIHPSIEGDVSGRIDTEASLPQDANLPLPLTNALGFSLGLEKSREQTFATYQVTSGDAGERRLAKIAGSKGMSMEDFPYDIALLKHDRITPRRKGKTVERGESHITILLPSLSKIHRHRALTNPGEFNVFSTKENAHPGIPTGPTLAAFVEAATDEQVFSPLLAKRKRPFR